MTGKFFGAATKTERFIIFEGGNNGLLKECKPFALRAQGLLCLGWKQRTTQTYKPCGFLTTRLSAGRRTAARCTDPTLYFFLISLLPSSDQVFDLTPITSLHIYRLCWNSHDLRRGRQKKEKIKNKKKKKRRNYYILPP